MTVSIITISYNSERTIEETIRSVLKEKNENLEYIVIDGLSTDGTMDIIGRYKDGIDVVVSKRTMVSPTRLIKALRWRLER